MERKLAAILAADVVGYSRLIAEDEARTLDALRALRRELFEPLVAEHRGEVVKRMGDGWLVSFGSVVDAAACAIQVQERLAGHDRIKLRIGVHLGDIVHEDEDIYGDGVNIAARLQEVAEPGGVLISGTAYESVIGRLDEQFEDAGEQILKNVSRPVRGWRWRSAASDKDKAEAPGLSTESLAASERPSIAVLPFDNLSSDPEYEIFADGLTEEVITALSRIARMRVIARNSTFAYKGKSNDLRKVASELGVRYVLEGSVRSAGNRLRITAQLIQADDGSHLWADRFDRTIQDIFDIQDEITKEIVSALQVELTDGEEARLLARGTDNIDAWQLCMRATDHYLRFTLVDMQKARQLAEQALRLDTDYAYAWATLGFAYWWEGRMSDPSEAGAKYERAKDCADQAMSHDDTLSWAVGLSAMVALSQSRDEEGLAVARNGYALNPGSADMRAFLGVALMRCGQYGEAIQHLRGAKSLNPFCPHWYRTNLARALTMLGAFEEALVLLNEVERLESTHLLTAVLKACVLVRLDKLDDAKEIVRKVSEIAPGLRLNRATGMLMIRDQAEVDWFVDSLRKAGFPE